MFLIHQVKWWTRCPVGKKLFQAMICRNLNQRDLIKNNLDTTIFERWYITLNKIHEIQSSHLYFGNTAICRRWFFLWISSYLKFCECFHLLQNCYHQGGNILIIPLAIHRRIGNLLQLCHLKISVSRSKQMALHLCFGVLLKNFMCTINLFGYVQFHNGNPFTILSFNRLSIQTKRRQ